MTPATPSVARAQLPMARRWRIRDAGAPVLAAVKSSGTAGVSAT